MPTSKTLRLLIGFYYMVLSILTPIVLSSPFPWHNFQETSRPTCDTRECKAMSEDLLQSIKHTVDPCKDFYDYVCGNWKKHHELKPSEGYLDTESILQYDAYKKLKSKLEEPIKSHEDPDIVKAKQLYYHCMELPYMEKVDASVLREHMKIHGFWAPSAKHHQTIESWLTIHNHYLSISGDSAFFQIDLTMSKEDLAPHIKLQRASSHYGALRHMHEWDANERGYYFEFLEKVIKMVVGNEASNVPTKTLEDDLRDVFNFRLSLQKMSISSIDPSTSTRLKISELSKWYNEGKSCPENGLGNIHWTEVFRAFLKPAKDMIITDETSIYVHSKDYLHKLCNLLTHTRQRTVVNHIHLYFMERHIALNPELKKLLLHCTTQGLASNGKIRYIPEQWYNCIRKHNMRDVLGSFYTKAYLTESMLEETNYMIDYIKDVIMLQVRNTKWLSDNAKRTTVDKLRTLKVVIGFPNKKDPKICPDTMSKMFEFSANPHAFYSDKDNVIFISSMYFQPPLYDRNLPFTITYATLGSLIAHEMYHMFDDKAVSNSALHQIWGKKATKHYKENAECIINYYSKQSIKELEFKTKDKPRVNALQTRDENIADIMGLKAAYNAYKKLVWARKGICPTLGEFKNIACDKLFFIAYARTFCSVIPEEKMVRRLLRSHHSPNRLRVNVPVSNMPEFSRAFKCELDAPLNLYDTCDIWA